MPEMERTYRKYQNGQVWAPGIIACMQTSPISFCTQATGITKYCLYSSLNFWKIKRICIENVTGEALLYNNFFHSNLLFFKKNSDCHKISFLNDGGLSFCYEMTCTLN